MDMGLVLGTMTATRKDPSLRGSRLLLIQPVDEAMNKVDRPLVALATEASVGYGEVVFYVTGGDAAIVIPGQQIPVDVAVVGLVDSVTAHER